MCPNMGYPIPASEVSLKDLKSFVSFRHLSLFVATVGACAIAVGLVTGPGAAPAQGACQGGYGPPNERPTASFGFQPTTPKVGEQVTFTSTSTDPNGDALVERWDFNGDYDPNNPDVSKLDAEGHTVAHTFSAPGDYRVTLRADDTCQNIDNAQQTVHVVLPPAPAPDTQPPALGTLGLSATVFRAARSGGSISAAKKPVGTKVSFKLSEPGKVKFTVDRKARGRKVGKSCKAQTKANRKRKACTRWVKVKGSFTVGGKAGVNSFKFRGRIGGKALKPGSYRLDGQATDSAKNRSAVKRRGFKIVR
jgi:plastocyanin